MKTAGVLLGIASLPSAYGVGDFGHEAFKFVNILAEMQVKIWQVLPLNPLGFGNSPYQPYSSFAGDELYISLDKLVDDGLLARDKVLPYNQFAQVIDYANVREFKRGLLELAYLNYLKNLQLQQECAKFVKENDWAYNYAVFLTLKKHNQMRQWSDWPVAEQNWIKDKQFDLSMFADKINYELFIQHVFQKQWLELKTYANNKNIQIMGDIPIYLGFDSLDVWQNQEMFLLDENNQPSFVAGVPPDYFSATGQRWGNPIYAWDKLEATEFEFWINRLRINSQMYDIIRIDHFRAFDTYWQIPAECPTAVIGEWIEAPGYKLFETIYKKLPDIKIVVEDLGDLRPQVLELRDKFKLAGMQVFQFVYQTNGNNHALENTQNTIVYTGTHDNETLMGWYYRQNKWQRKQLKKVFRANDLTIKNKIIKAVLSYQADYVIFPVQDLIGLGNSARINFPGKIGSPNWEWMLSDLSTLDNLAKWFAEQVIKNKR